jgi:hypothetical protein
MSKSIDQAIESKREEIRRLEAEIETLESEFTRCHGKPTGSRRNLYA